MRIMLVTPFRSAADAQGVQWNACRLPGDRVEENVSLVPGFELSTESKIVDVEMEVLSGVRTLDFRRNPYNFNLRPCPDHSSISFSGVKHILLNQSFMAIKNSYAKAEKRTGSIKETESTVTFSKAQIDLVLVILAG